MPAHLDAPTALALHAGAQHTVHATGHGIGGYLWNAEVVSGDAQVATHTAPPSAEAIGGGAGVAFDITAPTHGSSLLRFTYARPWEDTPEQVQDVRIEAKG